MPFLKLAEQTTALVNSSYAVGTLGRHFRAVLFITWRSSPRARELSQLKQNEPILLVQKQNKNQLRTNGVELLYAVSCARCQGTTWKGGRYRVGFQSGWQYVEEIADRQTKGLER